jgi:hypothetical protein
MLMTGTECLQVVSGGAKIYQCLFQILEVAMTSARQTNGAAARVLGPFVKGGLW